MRIEYEEDATAATDVNEREEISLPGVQAKTAQEELWQKISSKTEATPDPIVEEDVKSPDEPEEERVPDRTLVSDDLFEFLNANKQPEPDPIVEQASRLEAALNQISQPPQEPLSFEQVALQKLEALEQRMAQRDAELAAEKERAEAEQQMRNFQNKAHEFIEQNKEDYPGIASLNRADYVFAETVRQQQAGQRISLEDVAKKIESEIQSDFQKLSGALPTPSRAPETKKQSKPKQPPKVDDKPEEEFNLTDFVSKKDAQAALWERISSRGQTG